MSKRKEALEKYKAAVDLADKDGVGVIMRLTTERDALSARLKRAEDALEKWSIYWMNGNEFGMEDMNSETRAFLSEREGGDRDRLARAEDVIAEGITAVLYTSETASVEWAARAHKFLTKASEGES